MKIINAEKLLKKLDNIDTLDGSSGIIIEIPLSIAKFRDLIKECIEDDKPQQAPPPPPQELPH